MIELEPGRNDPNSNEIIAHVKANLSGYKAPKNVRVVATIGRSPSGKMDYGRHKREAAAWIDELRRADKA